MILKGPKRDYALNLTLHLVEKLEKEGSLIDLAARLTAGEVKEDEAFLYLKIAYQASGCLLPGEALKRFLREGKPESLLAELLLNLLSPLFSMKAVILERNDAWRTDIRPLRRFFLGVLGWTPQTVMREACLQDLHDAWKGFADYHAKRPETGPLPGFLNEMLKKFPDN